MLNYLGKWTVRQESVIIQQDLISPLELIYYSYIVQVGGEVKEHNNNNMLYLLKELNEY